MQATAAPKPKYQKLLPITYIYAVALAALAVVYLMGLGGFDFASIAYTTPGSPPVVVAVASVLIFALPFLLRFNLSRLARLLSALFALLAPFVVLGHVLYVALIYGTSLYLFDVAGGLGLCIMAIASFIVLNGVEVIKR